MESFILEEFTRFGGGQTVFEEVYSVMEKTFGRLKVVTDRNHPYLPNYIDNRNIIPTQFSDPEWGSPLKMLPKIYLLKNYLKKIPENSFSFNNHPNVFIYNATINFGHELFGFMGQVPKGLDKLKLKALKATGVFTVYNGAYYLTNGAYTKRILKEFFSQLGISNLTIELIDLPIHLPENLSFDKEENTVLTFGRISKDKKLEVVIELAHRMSETKFIISGRSVKSDSGYLEYLRKNSPSNLIIIPNPDNAEKDRLFRKAKLYLHTKDYENYGISVAEAVSYGCFPIVPKKSGAYEDILLNGKIGMGYLYKSELTELVEAGLGVSREQLQNIAGTRERFSRDLFKNKFQSIIENRTL